MAEVLSKLGSEHVMVVHGEDGMDEISISSPTRVTELKNKSMTTYMIKPTDLGFDMANLETIQVENVDASKAMMLDVLNGNKGPHRDITLLNAGADDYIGKPVDLFEVEARLRAILRRSQQTNEQQQIGKLRLDRTQKKIFIDDEQITLPAREFEVLFELMTPPGKTVSKKDLALKLSNSDEYLIDNAIESFISRIRKKIIKSNVNIRTLRGLGYLLEENNKV
jgi:DNA-binding response OmpR family regulator